MAKGGARPGAGRKPGVPNKDTRELQAKVAASGIMPLDYMLKIMRNSKEDAALRFQAAKAAAPYLHATLSSVDMAVTGQVQLGGVRPDDVEGACPPS